MDRFVGLGGGPSEKARRFRVFGSPPEFGGMVNTPALRCDAALLVLGRIQSIPALASRTSECPTGTDYSLTFGNRGEEESRSRRSKKPRQALSSEQNPTTQPSSLFPAENSLGWTADRSISVDATDVTPHSRRSCATKLPGTIAKSQSRTRPRLLVASVRPSGLKQAEARPEKHAKPYERTESGANHKELPFWRTLH